MNENGHSHVTPVAPVIVIICVAVDFALFNYQSMEILRLYELSSCEVFCKNETGKVYCTVQPGRFAYNKFSQL